MALWDGPKGTAIVSGTPPHRGIAHASILAKVDKDATPLLKSGQELGHLLAGVVIYKKPYILCHCEGRAQARPEAIPPPVWGMDKAFRSPARRWLRPLTGPRHDRTAGSCILSRLTSEPQATPLQSPSFSCTMLTRHRPAWDFPETFNSDPYFSKKGEASWMSSKSQAIRAPQP